MFLNAACLKQVRRCARGVPNGRTLQKAGTPRLGAGRQEGQCCWKEVSKEISRRRSARFGGKCRQGGGCADVGSCLVSYHGTSVSILVREKASRGF